MFRGHVPRRATVTAEPRAGGTFHIGPLSPQSLVQPLRCSLAILAKRWADPSLSLCLSLVYILGLPVVFSLTSYPSLSYPSKVSRDNSQEKPSEAEWEKRVLV